MHEHTQCEHEIKYCNVCDVCYCDKCGKQWSNFHISYTPSTTWIPADANPYTVTITNHTHE